MSPRLTSSSDLQEQEDWKGLVTVICLLLKSQGGSFTYDYADLVAVYDKASFTLEKQINGPWILRLVEND